MPTPLPPLPHRDPAGHKGTFGTALIIGGCARPETRMFGAPALTARAALRGPGNGRQKINDVLEAPYVQVFQLLITQYLD